MSEPGVRRPLPLWLTVVLGVAGTAVALWGIRAAAPILGPVVLAFVLTVTVHPLVGALVRRGVRRGLAVAVAVLVVDGGLIASALGSVLARTALAVGALVLVLATVVFMAIDANGMPERLAEVPGTSRLRGALDDFSRNTRRYLVTTTVFGFAVAVVDTIALFVLGIPLALLWGLLSFLTNYVPNIGFFLGLAPPTILALLVGGPGTAVLVIVIYTVVNFVLQSVLQPLVVGDVVGLSVTLSFLSVIVWTVVLGPLGAILAIPLTLLVVAVLVAQDPDRRWARTLLAGASGAHRGGERAGRRSTTGGTRRVRDERSLAPSPAVPAAEEAGEPSGRRQVGVDDDQDHSLPVTDDDGGEGRTGQRAGG